jgi:hypothetical protein
MNLRKLLVLCVGVTLAGWNSAQAMAQDEGDVSQETSVLLRMARDSAVVGHYRFSVQEHQQLVFDIPADDPRSALLESATVPREKTIEVAATLVSTPTQPEAERRYIAYWLGYKIEGDEVRGLTPLQWDSIFRKAGRRAIVRFTPQGRTRGVEVGSDAVRPVGQALASTLLGLATSLPFDSVSQGSRWQDRVAIAFDAPDGSRLIATVQVTYRLREFREGIDGLIARIEFDGEPVPSGAEDAAITGRYFGESYFAVTQGRYNQVMARANLEVEWKDASGLPPSRSMVKWQGQITKVVER